MIGKDKVLVIDVDGTLCEVRRSDQSYSDVAPHRAIIEKVKEYRARGFRIVLHTSRTMNTYEGNLGEIQAKTLPVLIDWLDRWAVPYDEIHVGKPWAGHQGFYIDDRAIRPKEFLALTESQIDELLERNRP